MESGTSTLLVYQCVHQPVSSTKHHFPEFLSEFHYVAVMDEMVGDMISSSHPSLDVRLTESANSPITWLVFQVTIAILSHLLNIISSVGQEPIMNNKGTPLTQEIPRI